MLSIDPKPSEIASTTSEDEPSSGSDNSDRHNELVVRDDSFHDEPVSFGKEKEQPGSNSRAAFLETDCGSLTIRSLIGLGIAGLAGSLVADVYGMFSVDCFLRAYRLPLRVFGMGSAIFAVINTANDVVGAYLLDWYVSRPGSPTAREDLVGISGCLYALSVLVPFVRWGPPTAANNAAGKTNSWRNLWDGFHFVGSLSVYDTMFSFNCILQGSIVSDNHTMTDQQRIWFFAGKDLVGILAPLLVTRIGLYLFDVSDLTIFRVFLVVLVGVSSALCLWGQALMRHHRKQNTKRWCSFLWPSSTTAVTSYAKVDGNEAEASDTGKENGEIAFDQGFSLANATSDASHANPTRSSSSSSSSNNNNLGFWRVVQDFAGHPNFRYWIGMEMLMEGQNTFLGNFQKTFVDQLLQHHDGNDGGWSKETCDWLLALLDPATQVVGLLLFLPIRKFGYARLYRVAFATNIVVASLLLIGNGWSNDENSSLAIASFLVVTTVVSNAMAGAGFGLAMCDMVLERKHQHSIVEGRSNPPSMAGLFMGVNALFCKPAESVLPILAASFLGASYNDDGSDGNEGNSDIHNDQSRVVLYRLLVLPPLVCAALQLALWSRYSLVPETTQRLRQELEEHEKQQQQEDDEEENNEPYSNSTLPAIEMNHLS